MTTALTSAGLPGCTARHSKAFAKPGGLDDSIYTNTLLLKCFSSWARLCVSLSAFGRSCWLAARGGQPKFRQLGLGGTDAGRPDIAGTDAGPGLLNCTSPISKHPHHPRPCLDRTGISTHSPRCHKRRVNGTRVVKKASRAHSSSVQMTHACMRARTVKKNRVNLKQACEPLISTPTSSPKP